MRRKVQILVMTLGLGLAVTPVLSAAASADTTCYTGCVPTSPSGGTPPVVTTSHAPSTAASSGALAFTGADVEGMVGIGGGALVLGGLLVVAGRRRRTTQ